ncbi:iron-containing redox enzyme family protein [Herbaspirillum seropedicae]|uniref:iron-containing redox enzyme family protein n=1 Tax=Herbaspirillum seropedicae TaxID=964 RepID=UPI00285CCA03|nr:iron-containing redox enzyme family protein [Herbaspirillum seropedicae]MDR6395269.1 hypothetical protein [Herbaspirillum seropedicae]
MQATLEEMQAAASASRRYHPNSDPHHDPHGAGLLPARIYAQLNVAEPDAAALAQARRYLVTQLEATQALPCELPPAGQDMAAWMQARAAQVGVAYEAYLQERRAGAPRQYFSGRAHALNFLLRVAPTKLVDGAWLYSAVKHWRDPVFRPLILTYLEELGDGEVAMNHVSLYRSLLQAHGCEQADWLSQAHYVQGALQLALGWHGDEFIPEMFGFNLGYEQLPLHLLITAYELNELGIDPYYFTLHVTIDNAASGHARKAVDAVLEAAAQWPDREEFLQRMRRGYLLNELGASTLGVIGSFDLDQEVQRVLADKAAFGRMMHSDYCRIGGKTVNQWLERPEGMRDFLAAMEQGKWILRGEPAGHSRFWRLIDAPGGEMFGVFNGYEKQVIREWIETGWDDAPRQPSFRALARGRQGAAEQPEQPHQEAPSHLDAGLDALVAPLSPACHHLPPGLEATRLFSQCYRTRCIV